MIRRAALSTFVAILVTVIVSLVAGTSPASAQQNPACCFYTVDIQGVPANCFDFKVYFRWDCNPNQQATIYATNGIFVAPIPTPPPCPPACRLGTISLNEMQGFIGPNQTFTYKVKDCCITATFDFDSNGCIYIKVRPGVPPCN